MTPAPASGAADQGAGLSFRKIIAERGRGRTARFRLAIRAAVHEGLLPGDAEDAMRRAPEGCASKFLAPVDRLVPKIVEIWRAVEAEAFEGPSRALLAPTYPSHAVPVDEARQAVHDAIAAHLAAGAGHRAIRVGTGIGKTRSAAQAIAEDICRRRTEGDRSAALYLVPTHRLGDEVAALFEAEGVSARVFRGRTAEDPETPGTGIAMCHDLEAVGLAVTLGRTVSTACCRGKHPKTGTVVQCPMFDACGYQRQTRESPDVWIGAHDLLFSAPSGLGEIGSVTVDEGFLETGLRIGKRGVTLDDLGAPRRSGGLFSRNSTQPTSRHGARPSSPPCADRRTRVGSSAGTSSRAVSMSSCARRPTLRNGSSRAR